MLLFWCEIDYLIVMAAWTAGLFVAVRSLLLWRRRLKANGDIRRSARLMLAFSIWSFLAVVTVIELGFAAFVDTTDAFSATNVSDRWFKRHVDPYLNNAGFRDRRDLTPGARDDVSQVFVFGDSFTIAQGINRLEDRFTDRVEAGLNRPGVSASNAVEVFNLGEFGWDVSLIEGVVKATFQEGYRPDVVVYVYMLNDIEGYDPRTEVAIREVQQTQPRFWLWSRTYFLNWLHFLWQQYDAGRTVDYFPHLADSYNSPVWLNVRSSLSRIQKQCEENGAEFRMVFFPFLHNLGPDYPFKHAHRKLAEFCEERGVRYLDLEPVLTPHRDEGLMVNRFDNHPNERCHALVADAIVSHLMNDEAGRDQSTQNNAEH
jgi:hypothetical protein